MNAFFDELFHTRIYKRSQGRITRQVTFAAMAIALIAVAYRLSDTMSETKPALYLGVPGLLLLVGVWICYRIVNLPAVCRLLIAVEAEMNKVSWPSRGELYRAFDRRAGGALHVDRGALRVRHRSGPRFSRPMNDRYPARYSNCWPNQRNRRD